MYNLQEANWCSIFNKSAFVNTSVMAISQNMFHPFVNKSFVFQLRNLILSAFPRNMRLPDPFTPNLKVELLPEISIAPRMVSNYAALIKPGFKKDLDSYLKNRSPVAFLSELRSNLLVASSGMADTSPGNRWPYFTCIKQFTSNYECVSCILVVHFKILQMIRLHSESIWNIRR